VSDNQVTENNFVMNRLEEIVKTLKAHIGEGVEAALDYLEQVLEHDTQRYNDFIQIKSRYNSLQRELLLGVLDHATYDISRNNISKALLLLADDITEKDLRPEGGGSKHDEDKRGEILYNVPDLMQLNHEEKCAVRIAFDLEHLKSDWVDSDEDVIKSIRVSEIMAVSLLNLDENDPPFAIRSFSETVQFVDKDDFTEWVFYVKPLKLGRFPLLLRVSVIEMINNKEYKKDIVLEEEITVQTEEVPPPGEADFKSAGTSITVGNTVVPPAEVAPPAAQAQEAGKKGLKTVVGALLTAAALAMSGYFGYQVYQENQQNKAWENAAKNGRVEDYEEYLSQYPDGAHSEEAQVAIDSLNAQMDSLHTTRGSVLPVSPQDTLSEISSDSVIVNGATDVQPDKQTPASPGKKKPSEKKTPKTKTQAKPIPSSPPNTTVAPTEPPKTELPPPAPTEILRGEHFYFRIPKFPIVQADEQQIDFRFYQFNQYREVLVILSCTGDVKLAPGTTLALTPNKGEAIFAELKYVATLPDLKNRFDGYFTIEAAELERLAKEQFKSLRLLSANRQVSKVFNLTRSGSRSLNRRAEEALKKLDEKK
jgi:hypothetical protein